jgi:hypothetical protein
MNGGCMCYENILPIHQAIRYDDKEYKVITEALLLY